MEPFEVAPDLISASSLEGTLIVEANITNITKRQRVFLSRMQEVESDSTVNVEEDRLFIANTGVPTPNGLGPTFETRAIVEVIDDSGNTYEFTEVAPGTYESIEDFSTLANMGYTLHVNTSDSQEYTSKTMVAQSFQSSIDNIYAERMVNGSGVEGMGIFVDASFSNGNSRLLRYTYEETYKIIAPQWTSREFEIIREETEFVLNPRTGEVAEVLYPDVRLVPREREEQVCFKTDFSNQEILVNANTLETNVSRRNLVRFIGKDNPIISHRYSILVKQLLVSAESFEFYERLRAFSQSESLFSQVQPGSLEGNVFDVDGDSQVIGYFDVSNEVSERLYFNYVDFFPGEPLPRYFGVIDCDIESVLAPPLYNPERDGPLPLDECGSPRPLIDYLNFGVVEFFLSNSDPPPICEGPYIVVNTICGDCNIVGSNVVPEFWTDE